MKQFWRVVLSRTFLIGLLVLGQIAFLATFFTIIDRSTAVYTLISFLSIIFAIIIFEKDNLGSGYRMMWLIIIVPLPITGLLYYFLFGKHAFTPKNSIELTDIEHRAAGIANHEYETTKELVSRDKSITRCVEYLSTFAAAPVYKNSQADYYPSGEEFFESFLQELEKAKRFIFMEYFIIEDDSEMWQKTLAILMKKAAQGVEVRVMYDSFGCLPRLAPDYDLHLKKLGINCYPFNELHFTFSIYDYKFFNHRDHRKITVIDGDVAFSGGVNFADEYINKVKLFGHWKDNAFCIKGPAVYKFTSLFLTLWDFTAKARTDFQSYKGTVQYNCNGYVQPYGDSPLDFENVAENTYINVINNAKDYVYIMTPYLIIDEEMFRCLSLAAKSGVDIRIMTPAIPDKWYAFYVTQSYYYSLLKAGVRIFEYTPGFVHAKMYVSDDSVAIIGSANMDYRSLYLHFENCCVFYYGDIVMSAKEDFINTFKQCREITLEEVKKTPLYKRILRALFRIFAPMM